MKNDNARIPSLEECITPCGTPVKTVYEPYFNGKYTILRPVGRKNTQDEIEAWAQFTDINYMLHRLKLGDKSVLSTQSPMYGDFSQLPTNPIDAVNLVHSAQSRFLYLDPEEKTKYNNDWRVWLASMFNGSCDSGAVMESDPVAGIENSATVKE